MLRKLIASVLIFSMVIPQNVYALVPEAVSQTEILQEEQIEQGEQGEQGEQVEQREPDEQGEQVESLTPDSEENPGQEDDRMVPVEEAVEELTGEEELIESSADDMPEETEANETDINEGDGEYTFSGGSGTEADPYKIASVYDLIDMAKFEYGSKTVYFKQTANIYVNSDIENPAFILKPCPGSTSVYYDGNNCWILNLYIEGKEELIKTAGSSQTLGLAFIQQANTIKNLTISGARIYCPELAPEETATSRTMYMSAIAGTVTHMDNCFLRGNIEFRNDCTYFQNPQIAGMVNKVGEITNSRINANVSSDIASVGGDTVFAGMAYSVMRMNGCSVSGNIIAKADKVSGLAAFDNYSVSSISEKMISDCTAKQGTFITNTYESGKAYGIVSSVSSEINGCKNYATLSATETVAGIAGDCHTMTSCINYGQFFDAKNRYGLVGSVGVNKNGTTTVSYCKNMADIDAHDMSSSYVSGIAGSVSNYKCQGNISFYKNSNEGDLSGHTVSGIVNNAGIGGLVIRECFNFGNIAGYNASGIADSVGEYRRSTDDDADICNIKDCGNEGNIESEYNAAGIARDAQSSLIKDCYNSGDISSGTFAAGIIQDITSGEKSSITSVSGCNNTGSISGKEIGGIIKSADYCAVEKCFNTGELTFSGKEDSNTAHIGGIVERINTNSSYMDSADRSVTVEDCYNAGTVNWTKAKNNVYIGGVVGEAIPGNGSIAVRRCYNVGSFSGIVSQNYGYVGAVVGEAPNKGSMTIVDNYYLESGFPGYSGYGSSGRGYVTTACTAGQMKNSSTYTGWDFMSTWTMGTGQYLYPILQHVAGAVYTITLKGNGGLFGEETEITRTTSGSGRLATIPRPKLTGKRFAGYYTSATGGERITKDYMFAGDSTIYAHWGEYDAEHRVTITPITPANGAKKASFADNDYVHMQISFEADSKIESLDLNGGSFRIVSVKTNETIYEAKTVRSFKITDSIRGSRVDFTFMYEGLEYGKDYYIEIEDGFIVFENDELYAFTDYESWHFNTGYNTRFKIRDEYKGVDQEINYDFEYTDKFFKDSAFNYNHKRAIWAFGLAMAGFESYRGGENGNYQSGYRNAAEMLKGFGFKNGMANEDYKKIPERYSFGTYCASKEITVDEGGTPKDYTLIAVATRGAGYSHEWYSNGIVGLGDQHEGFWLASNRMLNHIAFYIKDKGITGDVKIVMAGYSRAAATTNLTAARIDEGELAQKLSSAGISANIESKNVYAYCFEPPAVTRVRKLPSNDYNNIFCFINPADLVPMVPLSGAGWDYRRYGKTYYLPSPTTNSKNYVTFKESFLYRHKEFFKAEYDNNRFYQYINLSGAVWIKGKNSIASYLPGFFTRVKHAIPTYSYYYHHDQDTVADLLEYHFTKKSDFNAGEVLKSIITAIPALAFHIKSDIPTMLLNSYDYKNGLIFQMHEPSVNFTWLTTINGEEDYNTGEWNVIYLNCPIDASVYNSSNELVAQIVNDKPVEIEGSFIDSYVDENDQKVFALPKDDDFRIEIEATDNGTMDYAVAEYSLEEESYTKKTLYQDVAINKGNNLSGNVEADGDISFSKEGTGIAATQTFTGSVPEYEVSADIEGYGKVEGQGYIQIGNYVKLVAVPDPGAEFDGWYDNNGNLVSKDKEYRFRVDEAVSYRAKFSEIDGIMITPIERQEYSGQAVRPDVELHDGVTELVQGIDYTVTYKNNKNAFTFDDEDKLTDAQKKKAPQAIIKMKGNYSGKKIAYFCIDPLSIKDEGVFDAEFKKGNKAVVFKYNGKALKEKTDYTVDRINGSSVTISGKGNFIDTYDFTITDPKASVKKISMSKVVVDSIPAQFYTGEALTKDSFKAKDGKSSYTIRVSYPKGTVLKEGTDYRIAKILNPTKIGTATVVLKGLRAGGTDGASSKYSFIGEKRIKVKIKPGNINTAVVTGADGKEMLSAVYNKTGAVPDDLTVTVNGRVLKAGRDYTVKYSANTKYTGTGEESSKAGKLTIKGRGNFRGSKKLTFKITRRPFAKDSGITVVASDKPQSGKAGDFATEVKVFDREGGLLKAGTDYEKEIKYTAADGKAMDNAALVNEGDVITVTVKGKGGYTDGTVSTSYKVIKQGESNDISKASIRIDSLAYTKGRATLSGNNASHVKATMSGGRTLNFSTDGVGGDFMVLPGSYVNNDRKGTARVTFIGINGFSGAKTVKFKIGTRSLAEWWKGLFK